MKTHCQRSNFYIQYIKINYLKSSNCKKYFFQVVYLPVPPSVPNYCSVFGDVVDVFRILRLIMSLGNIIEGEFETHDTCISALTF